MSVDVQKALRKEARTLLVKANERLAKRPESLVAQRSASLAMQKTFCNHPDDSVERGQFTQQGRMYVALRCKACKVSTRVYLGAK